VTPARILAALDTRDLLEPLARIARDNGTTPAEVCGPSRLARVVRARHAFWAYLVTRRGFSKSAVARLFGRDPSTITSAVR